MQRYIIIKIFQQRKLSIEKTIVSKECKNNTIFFLHVK